MLCATTTFPISDGLFCRVIVATACSFFHADRKRLNESILYAPAEFHACVSVSGWFVALQLPPSHALADLVPAAAAAAVFPSLRAD